MATQVLIPVAALCQPRGIMKMDASLVTKVEASHQNSSLRDVRALEVATTQTVAVKISLK